jgi:glucose/arabinose dehydrogenase
MNRTRYGRFLSAVEAVAAAALFLVVAPAGAVGPPTDLTLELVEDGYLNPVAVTGAGDGSGRLFVIEQAGLITIVGGGTFLDITDRVDSTGNEQGLLGLAFHPDYSTNGYFYVNYTHDPAGVNPDVTRVSRFQVSAADPNLADASSETIILQFNQDFANHNGGDLHFGPDGYLYIAAGDGGSGFDPNNRGQSLDTLLGKLLRIDVDSGSPYSIPPDNPFVGDPTALDEIWAYGLRNPWRFSFDRASGDLFIGDVGQGSREEIDFQPRSSQGGENYGWSCMEGDLVQNFNPCDGNPLTAPVLVYDHGLGCSVTGGFRYRGNIGGLNGLYVFGDYCSGRIWLAAPGSGDWPVEEWTARGFGLSSFGEDDNGELYLVDRDDGQLYRFFSPSAIFTDGFESSDAGRWSAAVGG